MYVCIYRISVKSTYISYCELQCADKKCFNCPGLTCTYHCFQNLEQNAPPPRA